MDPARAALIRFMVKHPWWTLWGAAVAIVMGVAVIVLSGIAPIKASSGHWFLTAAFLDFAKTRSVATHSLGVEPPPLDEKSLVLKGAGHYEIGCASCHGSPAAPVPPPMAAMTPPPPDLPGLLRRWDAGELFTIVKHGIKFTGMPAWPSQRRDDEVWAMVAFLRQMPDLDAAAYRRLAYGDRGDPFDPVATTGPGGEPPPRIVSDVCARCHGSDGAGTRGAFPSLAGQRSGYTFAALLAFRDGSRSSGMMQTVAATLGDDEMREAAMYYERQPPPSARVGAAAPADAGAIATRGVPDRDIPACVECHGPAVTPKNPQYPRIDGQHASYLALQLRLFRERRRGGPNANLMESFVDRLTDDDIARVTRYYAALPPS
jgi:cytochrome c553